MTVDVNEIEALIGRAQKALNCEVTLIRDDSGWRAYKKRPGHEDLHDATLTAVIAKLQEWATPPKPATLTIEVAFVDAEALANQPENWPSTTTLPFWKACKDALKPWAQS